jgi:NTP pyrophosphatase (non-canonical NTP hydrolase)
MSNEDKDAEYYGQGGMGEAYSNLRKQEASLKRRDECTCECHNGKEIIHCVPCCEGDPIGELPEGFEVFAGLNFNQLTPAETERLSLLAEEMGEVIQVIGKILRHGYESSNPLKENSQINRRILEKEIGDVELIIYMMAEAHDIDRNDVDRARIEKSKKIGKWLHHQG